ncbi:uncharacterized protein [Littorina saxatilis]|uniref:uncharacterized protein n=1 Tax=Littorina saxatilis TaxID=31220 RepID=UPI0038B51FA5
MPAMPYGQDAGNVEIENCNASFIDIRENANNTIKCKGFNERDIIVWTFKRNNENIPKAVATCYPISNCTVHQPDHFAVERSPSHSTLFYQQHDREVDIAAKITCFSQFQESKRSKACEVNVINPAKLSRCAVEEDRVSGTVTGSCRFENAYSFKRQFTCTWYQEQVEESRQFTGTISRTIGSEDRGRCTFSSTDMVWVPGTSTYSILFYPGPEKVTVNISNINTNITQPTLGTTPATSSTEVSPPTKNVVSRSSPDVSLPTTKDTVDYTSPKTQNENDLPLGAIVGGIVAVIAVVIIVVVVVVVFVRRKKKQKSGGSAHGSSNDASNENDEFEEHINPMYVTNEDPDDTHSTDHKPSAIALRISSHSHNGHPAAPHLLDADIYTTVDGEANHAPSYQASGMGDRSGGYEDIGFCSNGNTRAPQKDEYAVVDKSKAKKSPASSVNTSGSSPAHTTEGTDEYAVVDKSSSQNKAAKNVASSLSAAATNNACADVYAQVNKSAKKVKVADPETEVAAYAQVQKPKPTVKPKTLAKPSSNKDVTQSSAADDDEYHTLRHTRGSPKTQGQADLESQYCHIGHD